MARRKTSVPIREPEEAWALAVENSGLVYSVLFRFINNHDNLVWYRGNDLQAEIESFAWEGMYNACLLWDSSKGTLSTYAVPAIYNTMLHALDKLIKMGGNQKGGGNVKLKYDKTPPIFSLEGLTEKKNEDLDMDGINTFSDALPQPWEDTETAEEKLLTRLDQERLIAKIEELTEQMPEPHRAVFKLLAIGPRKIQARGLRVRYATMGLRTGGEILHHSDITMKKLYLEALEWMSYQLEAANYGEEENDG